MELTNQKMAGNFWKFVFDCLDQDGIDIETFFITALHIVPNHADEVEQRLKTAKRRSEEFENGKCQWKDFCDAVDFFMISIMTANDLMKDL